MANKTFGDLPVRSSVTNNDFFITNRQNIQNSPEGRVSLQSLKNNIYKNLIVQNINLNSSNRVDVKTSNTSIYIDDEEGKSLIFNDLKKNSYGFFQISCTKANNVSIGNSVLGLYDLFWEPSDRKFPNNFFFTNQILTISNNNTENVTSPTCLFLNPFIPESAGKFRLRIRFTGNVSTAKCLIKTNIWVLQTQD
jgi:hypothetical protein